MGSGARTGQPSQEKDGIPFDVVVVQVSGDGCPGNVMRRPVAVGLRGYIVAAIGVVVGRDRKGDLRLQVILVGARKIDSRLKESSNDKMTPAW